jgi:hypothetical protein
LNRHARIAGRLLVVAAAAVLTATVSAAGFRAAGYAPTDEAKPLDTLRVRLVGHRPRTHRTGRVLGAVIPGYLSTRGLPPVPGRFTVTDTGLVFRSIGGTFARLPLVGPVRETAGRQWRASTISLAYIDQTNGRSAYVFRVDANVFETDTPGPLLDVASRPVWLDSMASTEWAVEQRLVSPGDTATLWATVRTVATSPYADSLYSLFGYPRARIGLIGKRGRAAGRLGEYIGRRDSLALDPSRMTGTEQLRHTLAHELGHRWQARAPAQVAALWSGVAPIRDTRRYGYRNTSEHQAEAIAFAVNFLQVTASGTEPAARSVRLLDHYELLVPGTRTMVRYLALQPVYRRHPLAGLLTRGRAG